MTNITEHLFPKEVERAAELLKEGQLVAFPTETVYGLGAPIFNAAAIAQLFLVKGRPKDNPLIAHISALKEVERIAIDISKEAYLLMEAFFPGPLTLLLSRHPDVPEEGSAGLPTIAVRMPSHPLAQRVIQLVGEPLVAPSANLSGKPSATCASDVLEDLRGKIAAVIDGGPSALGIESTVITLEKEPTILRLGAISPQAIEKILKREVKVLSRDSNHPPSSPGMKYRHYAPEAQLKLFTSEEDLSLYLTEHPRIKRLILSNKEIPSHRSLPLSAKELYSSLRLADREKCLEIIIFCDAVAMRDLALMDRLQRASGT
jgi:L-threonylcarbamoyladenylate synthase